MTKWQAALGPQPSGCVLSASSHISVQYAHNAQRTVLHTVKYCTAHSVLFAGATTVQWSYRFEFTQRIWRTLWPNGGWHLKGLKRVYIRNAGILRLLTRTLRISTRRWNANIFSCRIRACRPEFCVCVSSSPSGNVLQRLNLAVAQRRGEHWPAEQCVAVTSNRIQIEELIRSHRKRIKQNIWSTSALLETLEVTLYSLRPPRSSWSAYKVHTWYSKRNSIQ